MNIYYGILFIIIFWHKNNKKLLVKVAPLRPILYIFAGVNGAGKSTLTQSQFNKVITYYKVNADEISRRNGWDWHDDSKNLSAM